MTCDAMSCSQWRLFTFVPETESSRSLFILFCCVALAPPLRPGAEFRATMEYKLIMAVSGFPSLYDTNSLTYRDLNMRSEAWRQVAEIVGVPGEWLQVFSAAEHEPTAAPTNRESRPLEPGRLGVGVSELRD